MSGGQAVFDIAKMACVFMEVTPISSLDDGSELATLLSEQYDMARDACLETADWSFASKMVQLSAITPDANSGYVIDPDLPYAYGLPGDCLRIQEVYDGARWQIDAAMLRADVPAPLRLRYTSKTPNEERLPAEFRAAVAYRLAALLAPRFTNTQSKVAGLLDLAEQTLRRAARNHARDASPVRYDGRDEEPDWVDMVRR